mgnify:CR=1 FL=1
MHVREYEICDRQNSTIMKSFLLKYNQQTPRYTSYPPANYFTVDVGNTQYIECIEKSNSTGEKNISIYIHMPFCRQKCHFCGCNSLVWTNDSAIDEYFDAVLMEIVTVFGHLDTKNRRVTQIHWGGGTPNNLSISQIERVMKKIRSIVQFSFNPEIAIECNPAYLDEAYIDGLASLGFNRISLGIQDFDTTVLDAINRKPSLLPVDSLLAFLRDKNFQGVNFDLVYGLPRQTVESFISTTSRAIELRPARIVTFSYAHLPSAIPGQKMIDEYTLPTDDQKLEMFLAARQLLIDSGYIAIGFDHFALPDDELAVASREKMLKRNFQGYCTSQTTGQVYAFGASGISQLHGAYFQNEKSVDEYISRIKQSSLAVSRGYVLSRNEMVCQHVIEEILCNGLLDLEKISTSWKLPVHELFAICSFDPNELKPYIEDKLIVYTGQRLEIKGAGMLLARNVAQMFDPQRVNSLRGHSRTI